MIQQNLHSLLSIIPEHIKLVVVSKNHSTKEIMEVYQAGHKILGENKPQEILSKQLELPQDMEWHFIGHLQTNKVKYIAPFVHLIHAVDSWKLLKTIDKEGKKNERSIPCLLQFHIAREESKFGLSIDEAMEIISNPDFNNLSNVRICGVMGMASFTENTEQIRNEFKELKRIFEQLKQKCFLDNSDFTEISMGMSNDFEIAMEEGATILRIGSSIFKQE